MIPVWQLVPLAGVMLFMILLAGLIFHYHYRRVLRKDEATINGLKSDYARVRALTLRLKERRKFRRVRLNHEKCRIRIVDFKESSLSPLNNETLDGEMLDLSVGGMKFASKLDFPIRHGVDVTVTFTAKAMHFQLSGRVLRKEEKTGDTHVRYGVQFTELTAAQETLIQSLINQTDLDEKKGNHPKRTSR
ncbi:PilZ domain-containing protein [Sporolactobacillus vineae]|uniref:PilZ domain-containing protein n=1 Tax=Sporolactobacillus vineae TaxID=444463 RepID=UPI0002884351|nr:PilZ domain-containing protein [Sporolactobacillus vineae]